MYSSISGTSLSGDIFNLSRTKSDSVGSFMMAEAMINDRYRESLHSFDGLSIIDEGGGGSHGHETPPLGNLGTPKEEKRVKHGPTTIIELPEKRRKMSVSMTAKDIVESLNNAVAYDDRRDAICAATTAFDHNIQSLHDEELEVGADCALTKHLGYLMSRREIQPKDSGLTLMHELSCTCEALEMTYRGSPQSVSQSFSRFRAEVLATLIHLINFEVKDRSQMTENGSDEVAAALKSELEDSDSSQADSSDEKHEERHQGPRDDESGNIRSYSPPSPGIPAIADESCRRDHDVLLRKATKVMGHFARVGAATQPMAYFPGLLCCLINVLTVQPFDTIPAEARLNALWVLANLACNSENMVMMACHPNLLSSLIRMASRKTRSNDSVEVIVEIFRAHSIASRALVNLSWAPENRIPMSENAELVEALLPLAVLRDSPFGRRGRTVRDMMLQTRRHTLGTLRNLAAAPRRNKILLCQFQQGNILNVLTDAALNDPDVDVKERAFATIQNLAIHDTADTMVQNPALILALKDALLSTDGLDSDNLDTPIKQSASATLLVLERSITPDNMDQYQTLRELLDSLNPSTTPSTDSGHSDGETSQTTEV